MIRNLKFGICTVPRARGYIHGTIESLEKTGFFKHPFFLPLHISVAHPDSSFMDRYAHRRDMVISKQSAHEALTLGYDSLNTRQLSTWGHVRAMEMMLNSRAEWDMAAVLEDDVVFSKGWIPYLDRVLEKVVEKSGNRWILTLFQFTPHIRDAAALGRIFTDVPTNLFNGAPCFIYPRGILPSLIEYMMENSIRNFRNVNDFSVRDFASQNEIPIYATVPCLIQHVGDETTGQSDPNIQYRADLFFDSVEHLLKP